jgi:hypothetical protein
MKEMFEIVSIRLSEKGLLPVEISRIIKDVINIIRDGGESTLTLVNEKLERLGWRRHLLDFFSFELIRSFCEGSYITEQ